MLYAHQQKLLDYSPDKHLLAWECGTGKTRAVLSLAKSKTNNILVVCPKSLKEQWREQCSYDVMSKEEFKKSYKSIKKYDCLCLDEAHFFAGMQGLKKKSQLLKSLLDYIKIHNPQYIYLLTATPYMSSPFNLYALSEILGYKLNYGQFKKMFFQEVNMGLRWPVPVVRKGIEPLIGQIVQKIGSTVKMSDCFDVPEQVFQTEYFELTKEQKKAIDSLEDTAAIVRWTKVHQICGGTLKSDGYNEDKVFKNEKMPRILELAKENKKLVIVCRYNNEIDDLKDMLCEYNVKVINGAVKDRDIIVKEAESANECIVIVNAFCSEGFEIPSFPLMIFYSLDFSLKNFVQICGRILRANKLKKNVYKFLVVKKTIDEDVKKSMEKKENFQVEIYEKR